MAETKKNTLNKQSKLTQQQKIHHFDGIEGIVNGYVRLLEHNMCIYIYTHVFLAVQQIWMWMVPCNNGVLIRMVSGVERRKR